MNAQMQSEWGNLQKHFVRTPRVSLLWQRLDELRVLRADSMHPSAIQHLCVIGESGCGKTLAAYSYVMKNPPYAQTADFGETTTRPVAFAELPQPFTPKALYQGILRDALYVPLISRNPSVDTLFEILLMNLKVQRVEVLILDELQNIENRYMTLQSALNCFKHLANLAGVALCLVGTPSAQRYLEIDPQVSRRFNRHVFHSFYSCDDDWVELIWNMSKRLGFTDDHRLWDEETRNPQELLKCTGGKMWRLSQLLRILAAIARPQDNDVTKPLSCAVIREAYDRWLTWRGNTTGSHESTESEAVKDVDSAVLHTAQTGTRGSLVELPNTPCTSERVQNTGVVGLPSSRLRT